MRSCVWTFPVYSISSIKAKSNILCIQTVAFQTRKYNKSYKLSYESQARSGQSVSRAHSEQAVVAEGGEGVRGNRLHCRVQESTRGPRGVVSRRRVLANCVQQS